MRSSYSERFSCVYCGISLEELAPRSFSFNSPYGACPECTGLGTKLEVDAELVVTNPDLSINEGAILPWTRLAGISAWYAKQLNAVADQYGFSLDTPWKDLSENVQRTFLYGTQGEISFSYTNRQGVRRTHRTTFEGVIPNLERRYKDASESGREDIEQYMSARICPACHGARLKPEVLAVTVGERNISEVTSFSIINALRFFDLITAVETHFWWPDPPNDVRELTRTLKPGGTLILIAEIYRGSTSKIAELAEKHLPKTGMKLMTVDQHRQLLEQASLSDVQVFTEPDKGWICATGRKL